MTRRRAVIYKAVLHHSPSGLIYHGPMPRYSFLLGIMWQKIPKLYENMVHYVHYFLSFSYPQGRCYT